MGPLGHAGSNPAPSANIDADTGTCAGAATLGGFGSIPTGVSSGGSIRLATEAVLKTVEPRERPWEFDSLTLRQFRKCWDVAQLVEHAPDTRGVVGSTPTVPTRLQGSSVVEQAAVNRRVAGSSPASAASYWGVAQGVERASYIRVDAGSSPASPTRSCSRVAQVAEHPVEARSVVGATPTPRTNYRPWVAQTAEQAALNRQVAGATPALRTNPGVAQSGSALALGARGRWFDSSHLDQIRRRSPVDRTPGYGPGSGGSSPSGGTKIEVAVAQRAERRVVTAICVGSSPTRYPKLRCGHRSTVDRQPSKLGVAGSNPAVRSNASVAQLVERLICNQRVGGSIPPVSSRFDAGVAQLEERRSYKPECVGSSPTARTRLHGGSTTGCAPVSKTGGSRFEPCPPCQTRSCGGGRVRESRATDSKSVVKSRCRQLTAMKQRVEHPDCLSGVAGSTPVIAANFRGR